MIDFQRSQPGITLAAFSMASLFLTIGVSAPGSHASGVTVIAILISASFFAFGGIAASGRYPRFVAAGGAILAILLVTLAGLILFGTTPAPRFLYAI